MIDEPIHTAIIIPVHNEEGFLETCLEAACNAAFASTRAGLHSAVFAVLDRCVDRSAEIAARFPVHLLLTNAGSVGAARSSGATEAIQAGAQWLSFTDADTVVTVDWLDAQRRAGADAVCGTVTVGDWHLHDARVRVAYEAHYLDQDGHQHVHGANLGISTVAYQACGGFDHVALHEDIALVAKLKAQGFSVAYSNAPRVVTSARPTNRVQGGFAGFIAGLTRVAGEESSESAPTELRA